MLNHITGQHASATLHSLLSEDPWTVRNEASFPEIEIIDSGNMFSFSSEVKVMTYAETTYIIFTNKFV